MIYKLECDNCGELDYVKCNGYAVGDRLLEGVMFICFKDGHVEITENDADYFSTLNETLWLKRMADYFSEVDDVADCPQCGDDAQIYHSEDEWKKYRK